MSIIQENIKRVCINPLINIFQGLGGSFLLIWVGSTISIVGTRIIEFALSVWVYQKTGSALEFSGMLVAAALPTMIILPFAGSFADRIDRRYVMMISDGVAACLTLVLAYLLWKDVLEIWHLYTFNFIVSMAAAFQSPAFQAAVSASLSKDQMVRASGFMGASEGLVSTFTPLTAGALLGIVGLYGIVLLDLITFCLGSILVFMAVSNMPVVCEEEKAHVVSSAIKDFAYALSYFRDHRLMMALLLYNTVKNSLIAVASLMMVPFVLANHTALELGWIMTWGAVGGLIGSGLMIVKGNTKRLMPVFILCNFLLSSCVMIVGWSYSLWMYAICAFVGMLVGTVGNCYVRALWMRKLPVKLQGRIFALFGILLTAVVPIVVVTGGWLADRVFDPALAPDGIWADSIAKWFVISNGRGLALVFVISGFLGSLVSFGVFMRPKMRRIDGLVPDGR